MRKFLPALAGACSMLALAGSAYGVTVGVNDDAPKDAAVAPWFYSTMQATGLRLNALSIRWDEISPNDIPGEAAIRQAITRAAASGVEVELDLYPLHSQVFTGGSKCSNSSDPESCGNSSLIQQFASWTANVARTFPSVRQFVVMNECNQPLFVNPQWKTAADNQSAQVCGRALAAAYDALKAVSSQNFIWGVGLSPRGNDDALATSNSSTSPVKFLGYLGEWFRAFAKKTHRTAPLMDGFDFHPYPVPQTLPFAQGYSSPFSASVSNMSRIYQSFYDGFKGTPQRTIGQQAGGGTPVSLNETGIQTDAGSKAGYLGVEVSATAAGGVTGQFATESYQASWYQQMLNLVNCDPNIQVVNIFHLIDETSLAGWQSGLYFADQTPKLSAQTVRNAIGSGCTGGQKPWKPSTDVASAATTTSTTAVTVTASAKAATAKTAAAKAKAATAKAAKATAAKATAAKAKAAKAKAAKTKAAKSKAAGKGKSKAKKAVAAAASSHGKSKPASKGKSKK